MVADVKVNINTVEVRKFLKKFSRDQRKVIQKDRRAKGKKYKEAEERKESDRRKGGEKVKKSDTKRQASERKVIQRDRRAKQK